MLVGSRCDDSTLDTCLYLAVYLNNILHSYRSHLVRLLSPTTHRLFSSRLLIAGPCPDSLLNPPSYRWCRDARPPTELSDSPT
jgi:hypothetical protein